ncbi:MAG: molybdopterin-dependent oxidoreductase [Nocardioidaceae bacterium]
MSSPSRRYLALAGLVSGVAGIAVSVALTNLLNARVNPIQAVGQEVIAKTPGPVAEALIHVVGRNDKPLLVTGVTVGILLLSVLAGVLSGKRPVYGVLVFVAMGVVALLAAMAHPGFSPVTLIPIAAGVGAWIIALSLTVEQAPRSPTDPSRRAFLVRVGAVAAAAALVGIGGEVFGRARRAVEASRAQLHLPVSGGPVPAGAQLALPGITAWRVSNTAFYRIDTALSLPAVDPATWRLRIHGMVDREVTLDFQDLLRRRMTEDWITICCVSNPVGGNLIGNAWWSGVRVADVLAEAGVQPGATAVLQTSKDGWTCGTPVEALTDGRNAMLAIAMNGQPLPVEHGFPVRMIVPGLYGFVSATKWLVDLEVTTYDRFSAYWTQRGWSAQAPIKTESRVEVPGDGASVPAGRVRVGGSAWAQHTGIAKVEYRLDGHPWQVADLGRVPSVDTWVQWAGTVDAAPGAHKVAVRATDRTGYTQTAVRVGVVPNGATGWDTISFTAT